MDFDPKTLNIRLKGNSLYFNELVLDLNTTHDFKDIKKTSYMPYKGADFQSYLNNIFSYINKSFLNNMRFVSDGDSPNIFSNNMCYSISKNIFTESVKMTENQTSFVGFPTNVDDLEHKARIKFSHFLGTSLEKTNVVLTKDTLTGNNSASKTSCKFLFTLENYDYILNLDDVAGSFNGGITNILNNDFYVTLIIPQKMVEDIFYEVKSEQNKEDSYFDLIDCVNIFTSELYASFINDYITFVLDSVNQILLNHGYSNKWEKEYKREISRYIDIGKVISYFKLKDVFLHYEHCSSYSVVDALDLTIEHRKKILKRFNIDIDVDIMNTPSSLLTIPKDPRVLDITSLHYYSNYLPTILYNAKNQNGKDDDFIYKFLRLFKIKLNNMKNSYARTLDKPIKELTLSLLYRLEIFKYNI